MPDGGKIEPDHPSVHATAARDLGALIIGGTYRPGDRVPTEMEASERLRISRSAYREATRMLMAKGLLTSRKKAGTVVSPRASWNLLDPDVLAWFFESAPSETFIEDLFEMRMVVEPSAAAMAAKRRTPVQLADMEQALHTMRVTSLANAQGMAADRRFHELILAATTNEVLMSLSSGIGAAISWTTRFKQRDHALDRDPFPDHLRLFEAIRSQDPDGSRNAATMLLVRALEETRAALKAALGRQGQFDLPPLPPSYQLA